MPKANRPRMHGSGSLHVDVLDVPGLVVRLAPYRTGQVAPDSLSKAELQTFLCRDLTTFWHQSGTARMGVGPTPWVVNGRRKVHGLEGLTVADAPVFPRVTVGNTMAPSIGIGEMAAKLLTTP